MKRITYEVLSLLEDKKYIVEECRLLTPYISQIFLRPVEKNISYEAGQYIKIIHPDQNTSPFSIANAPLESSLLELHILQMRGIAEKQLLTLRGPYGNCTVSAMASDRPIIFVARGTGFAPIKAVIEAWLQKGSYPPIHLYWSVPGWRDLYLREQIESWVKTQSHFHFTAVLTRESLPHAKFGALPAAILQDYPDLSSHQIYASGPKDMIYSALYAFQQHGLSREWFYSDVFNYEE